MRQLAVCPADPAAPSTTSSRPLRRSLCVSTAATAATLPSASALSIVRADIAASRTCTIAAWATPTSVLRIGARSGCLALTARRSSSRPRGPDRCDHLPTLSYRSVPVHLVAVAYCTRRNLAAAFALDRSRRAPGSTSIFTRCLRAVHVCRRGSSALIALGSMRSRVAPRGLAALRLDASLVRASLALCLRVVAMSSEADSAAARLDSSVRVRWPQRSPGILAALTPAAGSPSALDRSAVRSSARTIDAHARQQHRVRLPASRARIDTRTI